MAFSYLTSVLFYEDYDLMSPEQRLLMQQGMEAFGGNAPTYRIALLDKPTIVWDFHSLILGIQMMFSFMITDTEKPIRICKALFADLCGKQTECDLLQPAVQE